LIGAVLNQRPELFGRRAPAVGVMDMLPLPQVTIGWAWVTSTGRPTSVGQFPFCTLTADHNMKRDALSRERSLRLPITTIASVPGHSFKYAATLAAAQGGPEPVLIRIETKAGHGAGKPTAEVIEEPDRPLGFLVHNRHMQLPAQIRRRRGLRETTACPK